MAEYRRRREYNCSGNSTMIEHVWTVLCHRSVVDGETNNISLIDVLERIGISLPPERATTLLQSDASGAQQRLMIPLSFEVVTLWKRVSLQEPAHGKGRLVLIGPDASELAVAREFEVDLTSHARLRSRARLSGIPLTTAGEYRFRTELLIDGEANWRQVGTTPFEVVFQAES